MVAGRTELSKGEIKGVGRGGLVLVETETACRPNIVVAKTTKTYKVLPRGHTNSDSAFCRIKKSNAM